VSGEAGREPVPGSGRAAAWRPPRRRVLHALHQCVGGLDRCAAAPHDAQSQRTPAYGHKIDGQRRIQGQHRMHGTHAHDTQYVHARAHTHTRVAQDTRLCVTGHTPVRHRTHACASQDTRLCVTGHTPVRHRTHACVLHVSQGARLIPGSLVQSHQAVSHTHTHTHTHTHAHTHTRTHTHVHAHTHAHTHTRTHTRTRTRTHTHGRITGYAPLYRLRTDTPYGVACLRRISVRGHTL
jgi:hypothetical protein